MNPVKEQIIETGKWIMQKGLTWGTSGNISARDGDAIYITASGTVLGDLKENDIIACDLNGKILDGRKKPSKETEMHLEIYRKCSDVEGVVHVSPFYSTFCACADLKLKTNLFIESMYYDERILRIPYYHAGSIALARAVREVCEQGHVILMENHGVLAYDRSLAECRSCLEVTENVCKMNLMAKMGDIMLLEVEPETVQDFLEGGYYKKRR